MEDTKPRSIAPVVRKISLFDKSEDVEYWRTQPYAARLEALELIRQEYHHWKYHAEPGFQRVYSIIKRSTGRIQDLADVEKLS